MTDDSKKQLTKKIIDIALNGSAEDSIKAASLIMSSIDKRYKFRPVRDSFDEAMKELHFFYTPMEFLEFIDIEYPVDIKTLTTEGCKFDDRKGWNDFSYLLIAKSPDVPGYPIGYINYEITEANISSYLKEQDYQKKLKNGAIYFEVKK